MPTRHTTPTATHMPPAWCRRNVPRDRPTHVRMSLARPKDHGVGRSVPRSTEATSVPPGVCGTWPLLAVWDPACLKMSGFTPILNFGHFWAALIDVFTPCFTPPDFLVNFGTTPLVQLLDTFLAEEEAQNLEFLPHPKVLPFLGPLLGHPFDLPNVKHLNT